MFPDNAMFYQHQHHKQFHQLLSRVKCRVVLACLAVGYVLCLAAMMVFYAPTSPSQEIYKDSNSEHSDFDAEDIQQKQSRTLNGVVELSDMKQPNGNHGKQSIVEQQNAKELVDSNVNHPKWTQLNVKQQDMKQTSAEQHVDLNMKYAAEFHHFVKHETFTSYQFDDNDAAVNTIPKPQVEHKRNKNQAVIMGHRKVKRRRGLRYNTPPIVTNLDGNAVTGLASY